MRFSREAERVQTIFNHIVMLDKLWYLWYYINMKNKSYWVGWLQAFSDAEGHIGTIGGWRGEIVISNTIKELLLYYQEGLNYFGIYSKILGPYQHTNIPNAKPIYRLRIQRRDDLILWSKLIGFQHPAKKEKLKKLIGHWVK